MKMAIKLVLTKPRQSSLSVIPCSHKIALGSHKQMIGNTFFMIIILNDDVFSGHLSAFFCLLALEWATVVGKRMWRFHLCLFLESANCILLSMSLPRTESGSTLRLRRSGHGVSLDAVHQLFLVLLLPERWCDSTSPPSLEWGLATWLALSSEMLTEVMPVIFKWTLFTPLSSPITATLWVFLKKELSFWNPEWLQSTLLAHTAQVVWEIEHTPLSHWDQGVVRNLLYPHPS